jgi:hypothetical protein
VVVACANVASVIVAQSLARRHVSPCAALGAAGRSYSSDRHRVSGVRAAASGLLAAAWEMTGLR